MSGDQRLPFGELLRRHRQAAGLTQVELAERAQLSMRGVNDLEHGARQHPRKDTVALLGEEAWVAVFAAGRALSLEQAAAEALEPLP
jgi:transcriptional regulator with XRE-family HTH domain